MKLDKNGKPLRKPGGWKCSVCGSIFVTRAKLRLHQNELNHKLPIGGLHKSLKYIKWSCKFCGKARETPIATKALHEKRCIENPNKIAYVGHKVSEETKRKISETCKKNRLSGGYRRGSGRGKKGTYEGFYCDSSWELAYVIYNLDHNINFKRNEELFPYEFNGEWHNYKPDFIEGDTYVEVKGYYTERVSAKVAFFTRPLRFIDKTNIGLYLSYVIEKYGKDFIKLYE